MRPQDVAQYQKAGRGFLITRNSATLADTDYEHIAKEIVRALNSAPELLATLEWLASKHTLGNKIGSLSADATRLDPYILEIRAAIACAKGAV